MKVSLRYVQARRNAAGAWRYYWRRPGFPLERLPDDSGERYRRAEQLNAWADGAPVQGGRRPRGRGPDPTPARTIEPGTVAAAIRTYQASRRYAQRARSTRAGYAVYLRQLEDLWGHLPLPALSRRAAVQWIESHRPGSRNLARAVLQNVLNDALNRGELDSNVVAGYRIDGHGKARDRLCSPAELEALWAAAAGTAQPEALRLALALLLYSGQRPRDVLELTWGQVEGGWIRLTQRKTGKRVELPQQQRLKAVLAAERTGRIAYGLELDPGYVDLAIARWEQLTGDTAVHVETGLGRATLSA